MKTRKPTLFFYLLGSTVFACDVPFTEPATFFELEKQAAAYESCGDRAEWSLTLFQKGDWDAARRVFNALPNQDPRLGAFAALSALDNRDAPSAFQWAVGAASGPWRAMTYYVAGRALTELGRSTEAAVMFGKSLESDSTFVEARLARAEIKERLGDFAGALKDFRGVLAVAPRHALARERTAALAARLGQPSEEGTTERTKISQHRSVAAIPAPGPRLRVGVGTDGRGRTLARPLVEIQCAGPFRWTDEAGKTLLKGREGVPWTVRVASSGLRVESPGFGKSFPNTRLTLRPDRSSDTVIVRGLPRGVGFTWSSLADREFRGDIELTVHNRGVRVVNIVGLEEYLRGVLPAEMPSRFPPEALKTQAVLARTYALFQKNVRRPHGALGYDLCDEQHCQVYGGVSGENDPANHALAATAGLILIRDGAPVHAVYSSHCGGRAQGGEEIGWGDVPYWGTASDEVFCRPSPFVELVKDRWVRITSAEEIAAKVRDRKDIGRIVSVAVSKRGASGRVTELLLQGSKGSLTITKESDVRRVLGLAMLRSTLFTLTPVFRGRHPAYFIMEGRGWGHGVGMCQSGAGGRAAAGHDFETIAAHYFPGTTLSSPTRRKP